jgi:5'(3')-deoxyribonucleotidase
VLEGGGSVIIACDADGVVCNLHEPWYARYNRDYKDQLTLARVTHWDVHKFVKPECGTKVYDYLTQPDLYDDVQPVPGALEGIQRLRALGHQITFVTSCTFGMTDAKARWFERYGFSERRPGHGLPRDMVVANDKNMIDAHLLIDDAAHNVRAWVESKQRRAILLEYPHNRGLLDEVPSAFWMRCHRAKDWPAIVRYVEQLA